MTGPTPAHSLRVVFGSTHTAVEEYAGTITLRLSLPVLQGRNEEIILATGDRPRIKYGQQFRLLEHDNGLCGAASLDADNDLEQRVAGLYDELLELCGDTCRLYRIWVYLPRINATENGLERYRQFNLGRWQAFEKHFGGHLTPHLPAASAVGADGSHLALVFLAGHKPPVYLENPRQVPAYHYPADYGPRAPGFARATVAKGETELTGWLSGTASIIGHQSVGQNDFERQLEVTWANILEMTGRMGMDASNLADYSRNLKVYLRHSENLGRTQRFLEEKGLFPEDLTFLRADICRAELDVEIEGRFRKM